MDLKDNVTVQKKKVIFSEANSLVLYLLEKQPLKWPVRA